MRQLELGMHSPVAGSPKKPKEKARKSAQVPAQFLGYSLQQTRLLQLVLDGQAGAIYILEVFEDVGEELRNGHRLASQTKSSLRLCQEDAKASCRTRDEGGPFGAVL